MDNTETLQLELFNELVLDPLLLDKMSPEFFADYCVVELDGENKTTQATIPAYLQGNLLTDGFLAALIYRGNDVYLGFVHYNRVEETFLRNLAENLLYLPELVSVDPSTYH